MTEKCNCPRDFPDWDNRDVDLGGYHAHRLSIPMLMHMPLAYELYASRQQQAIERMEVEEIWPGLTLTTTGMFRGSLMRLLKPANSLSSYIKVLPCPFNLHGKLHHGNVSTIRSSVREVQMNLVDNGRVPKELYLSHLTCPACSEERGDMILLLRRWVESPSLKRYALKHRQVAD